MSPETVHDQSIIEIADGSKHGAAGVARSVTKVTTALVRIAAHKLGLKLRI